MASAELPLFLMQNVNTQQHASRHPVGPRNSAARIYSAKAFILFLGIHFVTLRYIYSTSQSSVVADIKKRVGSKIVSFNWILVSSASRWCCTASYSVTMLFSSTKSCGSKARAHPAEENDWNVRTYHCILVDVRGLWCCRLYASALLFKSQFPTAW